MRDRHDRTLLLAGWVFAGGSAIHVVDHLRRGQGSISEELYLAGNLALVLQVVVVTLVLARHRMAPLVATAAGFTLALGFAAAHWLPTWSALSDPVWEIESARWFSYLASSLEIIGAVAVALAGLAVVRHRGLGFFAIRAGGGRSPAVGVASPVAAAKTSGGAHDD